MNSLAALALIAPPFVDKVDITITTGDDLRGDSSAMMILNCRTGRKGAPLSRPGRGLPGNGSVTRTVIPPANTRIEDLHQVRIDFKSGKATGFDDHWTIKGIKVEAHVGSRKEIVFHRPNANAHLMFSQTWATPFFPKAVSTEIVNPSDVFAEFDIGNDDFRPQSKLFLDFELTDGRFWRGYRLGSQVLNDRFSPGLRVTSLASDKFPIHMMRQIRVGFESGRLTANEPFHQLDTGDDFSMRGVRFFYRGASGDKIPLATFPEVNHRFLEGGWWQAPMFRPFERKAGEPLGLLQIDVLTGMDDLRRMELPREQQVYNSKADIFFNLPIVPVPAYAEWLINGDYIRRWVDPKATSKIAMAGDNFPENWTGHFGGWKRFTKVVEAPNTPFFLTSDLFGVSVRFRQGQGGDVRPTRSSGGGLIGDLRQPDNWDLQGLIISVAAPNGPVKRIYSNFGINRRFSADRQTWKSQPFETALLRLLPKP